MKRIEMGDLLWSPSADVIAAANLERYRLWVGARYGVAADDYAALWRWSVTHLETFWESLFGYFDLRYSQRWTTPLVARTMPGARWFPGAQLNFAENIFARAADDRPAIVYADEGEQYGEIGWRAFGAQVAQAAAALQAAGVVPGDVVAGYLPNIPEAVIAMLAAASIGAIWSSCSPDFGAPGVLDRFQQIAPKVLIAVTGYRYGGRLHDRRDVVGELIAGLPSLHAVFTLTFEALAFDAAPLVHEWSAALDQMGMATLTFTQVPFDHPLWVLYSSGTTGLPKPIVQGHGGILLEHVKATALHHDLKPGDRFFWYSSTGWMMWNYTIGSLLSGATIILYNGSPASPDLDVLFRLAERSGMTYFGTSAAFLHACMKAGMQPNTRCDLSRLRAVGSTGSPLSTDGFAWVYEALNPTLALESMSGGTDLCTAFISGVRTQPIYAGELQGAALGARVYAFDEAGQPVTDTVGELVISAPMPSMPLYLWGDDAAMTRYRASYFDLYPGVWRHGDWVSINGRGGCVIYGRSDSTINRQGIRMGTAELYRVVEALPEIVDSLIVDLELLGRESRLLLFVVLHAGAVLTDELRQTITARLRADVSPRHVPDAIVQIDAVPYTLSGKKMEVPVRKILLGFDAGSAAKASAMRNPEALDFFIDCARTGRTL